MREALNPKVFRPENSAVGLLCQATRREGLTFEKDNDRNRDSGLIGIEKTGTQMMRQCEYIHKYCRTALVSLVYCTLSFWSGCSFVYVDAEGEAGFRRMAGQWKIEYSDETARTYDITADGSVFYHEEKQYGLIEYIPPYFWVQFDDRTIERVRLVGDQLRVERWESERGQPFRPSDTTGVGIRKQDARWLFEFD